MIKRSKDENGQWYFGLINFFAVQSYIYKMILKNLGNCKCKNLYSFTKKIVPNFLRFS